MKPTLRQLYALATALWLVAGINVLRIGLMAWARGGYMPDRSLILWGLLSLSFFSLGIFPRVVRRNLVYMQALPQEQLRWYRCFTPSSWIIMVGMITLGVVVRALHLAPQTFIAGFYSGLGLSLILATYPYLRRIFTIAR